MPRFAEMFDPQALDHQSNIGNLNKMAEAAGWIVLQPGQSIRLDRDGHSIVISGVTWSKQDLELLDELASRDTGSRSSIICAFIRRRCVASLGVALRISMAAVVQERSRFTAGDGCPPPGVRKERSASSCGS